MSKLPDTITVTFTEEDRQTADHYHESCGCLLHTALTRMGFKNVRIGACGDTFIGDNLYEPVEAFNSSVERDRPIRKPYYKKSVVGKTIHLVSR